MQEVSQQFIDDLNQAVKDYIEEWWQWPPAIKTIEEYQRECEWKRMVTKIKGETDYGYKR